MQESFSRKIGTSAHGIRLPIISKGDDLANIVVDSLIEATNYHQVKLNNRDVLGITEAIVAKSQGNYATVDDIAKDVRQKFPEGSVGLVFPIISRNRFLNVLKGIAKGVDKLYLLLSYPQDEMGNPIVDVNILADKEDEIEQTLFTKEEFREYFGVYKHPFTQMDYVDLYQSVGDNIEIYFSKNAKDILKLTPNIIEAEVHNRHLNKKRLLRLGAKKVVCLDEILNSPIDGSGYNEKYGILGSNIANDNVLKLFPRDCDTFVNRIQQLLLEKTGKKLEVLVYGDGAFKDPVCGIWELADPVVSPGYTSGLNGTPNELKIKYIADAKLSDLDADDKKTAITDMIKNKQSQNGNYSEGTTPRQYTDLIGSLCDLMSGSGDKGTPVILIQGYFDDYSSN